jgi:hypothetical protein
VINQKSKVIIFCYLLAKSRLDLRQGTPKSSSNVTAVLCSERNQVKGSNLTHAQEMIRGYAKLSGHNFGYWNMLLTQTQAWETVL